ncbi:MAG: ribosome rescue GTPase HflX [Gammaproteobacteria bacterium]
MNEAVTPDVRAVLVHIDFHNSRFDEELDEFVLLAESSGLSPVLVINGQRELPDPRYFVGKGKVEEIRDAVVSTDAELVLFNHELSPAQERNVERVTQCRVLDRVGLILDIFAQRARSYEGKLQVELAQLQHLSTRLVRGWSHLERQKGGIGLRGPGETQLETDRRLIGKRIKTINTRLGKVTRQRQQSGRLRKRSGTPVISLVGYTNAGKSTLFNQLTGASVYAADKLFATLDPTLRRVELDGNFPVIFSDTVGFIRHIPHDLIQSFHATLEEVRSADLLLHVIDVTDEQRYQHLEQVNEVIEDIGAAAVPQILVFNKVDANEGACRVEYTNGGLPRVWISAGTGEGLAALKSVLLECLNNSGEIHQLRVPPEAGRFRASLFRQGAVCEEHPDNTGGWVMEINLDSPSLRRLCRDHNMDLSMLQ